jgi:NAD(P) transhydrogenase subunit alpha
MIGIFILANDIVEPAAAAGSHGNLILLVAVFVLAIFVGFEIITKIPPTLHTPLMSGSNAISGITVIGSLLSAGGEHLLLAKILGCLAVILAMMNVVGGFLVTHRMLGMFRRKG